MHVLFTIDYLIHEICSHIPRYRLPILARVSSTWFRYAISLLYSDFNTQSQMLLLYAKFHSCSNDDDLKRLLKYTPFIRELRINSDFEAFLLNAIRKSPFWGSPHILPNVQNLNWEFPRYSPECVEIAVNLITPKIDQLSLYTQDDRILHCLCPLVVARLPALHSLAIQRVNTDIDSLPEKPVQDLLTFFSNTLTSIRISPSLCTPAIVECLSKMPNLSSLSIGKRSIKVRGRILLDGNGRGFPSLCSFAFEGLSLSFHDTFLKPYGLTSLTGLALCAKFTPADVRKLVLSIVVMCPHLIGLSLGERLEGFLRDDWPIVPWVSLQPISRCKELTGLTLNGMVVSVGLVELVEFLKSRTTWRRLHVLTSTPLHLRNMLLYAQYCPHLEHLGIIIANPDGFCIGDLPSDAPTFSKLTSIDFSPSVIAEANSRPFAQFLHRICKKPPYELCGLDKHVIDEIFRNLAILYIAEQFENRSPMSREVEKLVTMVLKKGLKL